MVLVQFQTNSPVLIYTYTCTYLGKLPSPKEKKEVLSWQLKQRGLHGVLARPAIPSVLFLVSIFDLLLFS